MTPERLKEIKERWATSFDKDAPGERATAVRELVAEVERLQGIVRWREEPVDKRLHGDLMRAATKSSHELIAVTVERDGLKRGVGHLAAERDSLAAQLAVAREALQYADGRTASDVQEKVSRALARIDGDGTEGFPPKQEDCPAEFLAVANTLEPLTSEGAGTEGKGG